MQQAFFFWGGRGKRGPFSHEKFLESYFRKWEMKLYLLLKRISKRSVLGSGGINALEDLDCQIAALGYIGCSSFILSLHTWVRSTIWKKCWVSSVSLLRLNALCDICPFLSLACVLNQHNKWISAFYVCRRILP